MPKTSPSALFHRSLALLGLLLGLLASASQAQTYKYNERNWLVEAVYPDGTRIDYDYDSVGNLLSWKALLGGGGGGGNGSSNSGCFIATAAYGSAMHPHVDALRGFRDRWLLTHAPGRALVELYYATSPPIADLISRHAVLRGLARLGLAPLVYALVYPQWAAALLGVAALALLRRRLRRRLVRAAALGLLAVVLLAPGANAHLVFPQQIILRPGASANLNVDDGGSCSAKITVTSTNPAYVFVDGFPFKVKNAVKADFTISASAIAPPMSTLLTVSWVGEHVGTTGPCQEDNTLNPVFVSVTILPLSGTMGSSLHEGYDSDPISTDDGEFFLPEPPDLSLGGPLPLEFSRYYASGLTRDQVPNGGLGPNWRHNFDWRMTLSSGLAEIHTDEGRLIRFDQLPGQTAWTLSLIEDLPFQLVQNGALFDLGDQRTRLVYSFNSAGQLVQIRDGKGNSHILSYSGTELAQVDDGLGRTLTFTYDASSRVTAVSDGTRAVGFTYDASGHLIEVTNVLGKDTLYTYDPAAPFPGALPDAWLTAVTRPNGNTPITNTYAASGKVLSQVDAYGNAWGLSYGSGTTITRPDMTTNVHQHSGGDLTSVQDADGNSVSLAYDSKKRRTRVTDREGDDMQVAFDQSSGLPRQFTRADGFKTTIDRTSWSTSGLTFYESSKITQPDGTSISFAYDTQGNLTSRMEPGGGTWSFDYNGRGQPTVVTNPEGGVTHYGYNADATLASITDDSGSQTSYSFDSLKRVSSIDFESGASVSFTLNLGDKLTRITDGLGGTWDYAYDDNLNLTSRKTPDGQVTAFRWDLMDRFEGRTWPLGGVTQFGFDSLGRRDQFTNANGFSLAYDYDNLNQVVGTTDPLGRTASATRDREGVVSSVTNPGGAIALIDADELGRITKRTVPTGAAGNAVSTYDWDGLSRISRLRDPRNNAINIDYTPGGQIDSVRSEDGTRVNYSYNNLDQLTGFTLPDNASWTLGYDLQGRNTSWTDALGNTLSTIYDASNNPSVTDLAGLGTLTRSYDLANRPTGLDYSDGLSLSVQWDPTDRLTGALGFSASYNANGWISNSNGVQVTRDAGNRVTAFNYPGGLKVDYTYYGDDRLRRVSDSTGGWMNFSYDLDGNNTLITRSNSVRTNKTFTPDGLLESFSHGNLSSALLGRDLNGNLISAIRDYLTSGALLPFCNDFTYNPGQQISTAVYDDLGRFQSLGALSYTWGLSGSLKQFDDGSQTIDFLSDFFGRPTSFTTGGVTTDFTWNYATEVPALVDQATNSIRDCWYVTAPWGEILYSVDALTSAKTFFHQDENYNINVATDDSSAPTVAYDYTPRGQLYTQFGVSSSFLRHRGAFSSITFNKDLAWDNFEGRYRSPDLSAYLTGRFEPEKALTLINGYALDSNNPLSFGDRRRSELVPQTLHPIERIQVLPGSESRDSALYGSKAIAGTINLITRGSGSNPTITGGFGGPGGSRRRAAIKLGRSWTSVRQLVEKDSTAALLERIPRIEVLDPRTGVVNPGQRTFNLRGLGDDRTLVLVNGRRPRVRGVGNRITGNKDDLVDSLLSGAARGAFARRDLSTRRTLGIEGFTFGLQRDF